MLRGDVHRFYLRLRQQVPNPAASPVPALRHVREIRDYYARLRPEDRQLLLAWAKKEENGIGLIPSTLSGIPLIGLLFAPLFQDWFRRLPPGGWAALWLAGTTAFVAGIYIHQRQKAFTALHLQVLTMLHSRDRESTPTQPTVEKAEADWRGSETLNGIRLSEPFPGTGRILH